jgi:hypothetical protein
MPEDMSLIGPSGLSVIGALAVLFAMIVIVAIIVGLILLGIKVSNNPNANRNDQLLMEIARSQSNIVQILERMTFAPPPQSSQNGDEQRVKVMPKEGWDG